MNRWRFNGSFITALLIVVGSMQAASGAPVDELIAGAKKEGVIELYAPSTLTPQGAQRLGEAFNKQYNLNVRLHFNPSGSMTRDVGTNQFVLPAYNKQLVPAQDVPRSWQDLLDPKWKGGKLGMSTATHHLARLATLWGESKTTEYVKLLARQEPMLGEFGTLYTRLQLGEILVTITMTDSFTHQAKVKGAPIVHAEEVTPVISPAYNAGVLKGSPHPNTGHLFSAFLTTPPAQEILQKFGGQTSAFVPGTPAYKYAQGKKVIYMKQEQAEMVDRLTTEYGKIFGFQQ